MPRCAHCNNFQTGNDDESYRTCTTSFGGPCDACKKLSSLNIQISETRDILEGLLNQRRALKSNINQLHQSLVDRMPVEVSSAIFEFYVGGHGRSSPLTLGAICQTWRRIAWSTPQLWTFISMDLSITPEYVSERAIQKYRILAQLLSDWTARSGCFPLSIELYATHPFEYLYAQTLSLSPIIQIVNSLSTRWKRLDLRLPLSVLPEFFGYSCKFDVASSLEEVRIWNTTGIEDQTEGLFHPEGRVDTGGNGWVKPAPKLVNLAAVRINLLPIEWTNVTRLNVKTVYIDEIFLVLRHSPSLVDCIISRLYLPEDGEVGDIPDPDLPFVHHNLKQLHIKFYDPVCPSEFFSRVAFPRLEDLTCNLNEFSLPADTFVSFLSRSALSVNRPALPVSHLSNTGSNMTNTNLKVLNFILPAFDGGGADLIQICKVVPALKEFRLHPGPPDGDTSLDVFYRALSNDTPATPGEGGQSTTGNTVTIEDSTQSETEEPMLLPGLEFFKTCTSYNAAFPLDLIPGFFLPFKGRGPSRSRPLRTLDIACMADIADPPPSFDTETLAFLHDLIKQGVDLTICSATLGGETDLIQYPGSG